SRSARRASMAVGIAMWQADSSRLGGNARATVAENVTLVTLRKYFRRCLLRRRRELKAVRATLDAFAVRPPEPLARFGSLSGGNQQKALLAKWFAREPRVMVLHEPTQGVDIAARRQIFRQIRQAADD